MIREITTTGPIRARVAVPGSKSITNRAMVCAALARGESRIVNPSDSDDTTLLVNALNQLGVLVRPSPRGSIVQGTGGVLYAPKMPIPVGNAGTTFRFLLAVAQLAKGTVHFETAPRMAQRPVDELVEALQVLGGNVQLGPGWTHVAVAGNGLHGGALRLRADRSSQFLSSLLLVAPLAADTITLTVEGALTSASYAAMTLGVMRHFGVDVKRDDMTFTVAAGQRYRPVEYRVDVDASGASYFMAAAAITGGDVVIDGMRLSTDQGDARFGEILELMGCRVIEENDGVRVSGGPVLRGIDVDMNGMPDSVPTLAAAALFAEGTTRIRNVAHLRYKESDRLGALAEELRRLGANIKVYDDGLEVHPAPLHGATLDTYEDHRLAMSFALIGLRVPGVVVENPACVKKSFPRFWEVLESATSPAGGTTG